MAVTLYSASKVGDLAKVSEFLSSDPDCAKRVDNYGFTALHWAAMFGHVEVSRKLIKRGVSVNLQGLWGNTALHQAAMWGHVSACRLLLESGADISVRNRDGATPLDCARMMSKKDGKPSEFEDIIKILTDGLT